MIYDDLNKKWVPSGTSHGLSKVHIYHHFINNTFRVVGRKLQDHEVRTLSLNLSGGQKKSLLKTFVVLYYVLSYFVCFLPTLHTVSYFRVQFPVRRILMHCAVFDTLDKIVLFFFEKRVMFLKRFSSSFINRFFKAGVKIQVDLTGCSLHIESFG